MHGCSGSTVVVVKGSFADIVGRLAVVAVVAGLLTACSPSGSIAITTSGGDFAEQGIPSSAFADGADVVFSRFLVHIDEATLARDDVDGSVGAGAAVFDVARDGPTPFTTIAGLEPGRWDAVVAIGPAGADGTNDTAANDTGAGDSASADDVALLVDNGFSVFVEGDATVDGRAYGFAWGFSTSTRYTDCRDENDDEGILVTADAITEWQLTVQPDALFRDDLSADGLLRFAAIAGADGNDDGFVDLDELDAVALDDLTEALPDAYGRGAATGVDSLRDFISEQTRRLVHINGTGTCTAEKR